MVLPSNAIPPDASWIARELATLRQEQREGMASIAASFRGTVNDLAATVAEQQKVTDFLLSQQQATEQGAYFSASSITGIEVEYPFDPSYDREIVFETSSTGRVLVQGWGYIFAQQFSGSIQAQIATMCAIRQGATKVWERGLKVIQVDTPNTSAESYFTSIPQVVTLAPHTEYTLRTARYRAVYTGTLATGVWEDTAVMTTLLGM